MRTLSDAAMYKLPDAPNDNAVTGDSPLCVIPILILPDNVFPDEHSVLMAFEWLDRRSQTRTNGPQAENSKSVLTSCSTATTGPACDSKPIGPFELFKSQIRTVRSESLACVFEFEFSYFHSMIYDYSKMNTWLVMGRIFIPGIYPGKYPVFIGY